MINYKSFLIFCYKSIEMNFQEDTNVEKRSLKSVSRSLFPVVHDDRVIVNWLWYPHLANTICDYFSGRDKRQICTYFFSDIFISRGINDVASVM